MLCSVIMICYTNLFQMLFMYYNKYMDKIARIILNNIVCLNI